MPCKVKGKPASRPAENRIPSAWHACPPAALQALRRLIVFGFQSDARTLEPVPVVTQTVPVLLQALQTLLAARPAKGAPRSQLAVMLDRGLIKLAKVITNVQEAHPWYLPPNLLSMPFCTGLHSSIRHDPNVEMQ